MTDNTEITAEPAAAAAGPDPVAPEGSALEYLAVDGKKIVLLKDKFDYEVLIPEGHPRVPRTTAAATDKSAAVTVDQAMIAGTASNGRAKVTVVSGKTAYTYYVKFVKSSSCGFALQYDDRYVFRPSYKLASGESFTYASANTSVVTVDSTGNLTAKAVSASPVAVTASVNGKVKETFYVTVDPAQVCIFLIVGQSNAAGTYDDSDSNSGQSDMPAPGISYCVNVKDGKEFDLSAGRSGFAPALGKRWYALTGEKSVMIQGAVGGSPVENWQKNGAVYGKNGNAYDNTYAKFLQVREKYTSSANFEIIRIGAFWCQGETAQVNQWGGSGWITSGNLKIQTAAEYYPLFMKVYDNFVKEMNVEFFSIALVRALKQTVCEQNFTDKIMTDLVAPRAAQYTANHATDDKLFIASRICDIARSLDAPDKVSEGYGYMGSKNIHYSQKGYNAQGIELANNTYARLCPETDRDPAELEVIDTNGRDRLADGATINVEQTKGHRVAAIVLPLYTSAPRLTYSATAPASVDIFGNITFAAGTPLGSEATLTIRSESGLCKTYRLVLIADKEPGSDMPIIGADLTLHWDFNDLNEADGKSDLTLSEKSPKTNNYTLENGVINLPERETDFVLATPFRLNQNFDWSIEWRGMTSVSSALFGQSYSNNNFIYFAVTTPSWGNPFRMVSSDGTAAMIKLSDDYVKKGAEMNTWKIDYKASTRTMTLYFMGDGTKNEVVGTYKWSNDFEFIITNMFGRYGSSSAKVNWKGSMDYIHVVAHTLENWSW